MLLKIASRDHLHSQLVDVKTGVTLYTTMTRSAFTRTPPKSANAIPKSSRVSVSSQLTSSSASSSRTLHERSWDYPLDRFADGSPIPFKDDNIKHTLLLDAEERVVAEIVFIGTSPSAIKIAGEEPLYGRFCSTGLFPSADNQSDLFVVSTRIDDLEWVMSKSSMELLTADGEPAMSYHPNARVDDVNTLRPAYLRGDAFLEVHDIIDNLEKEQTVELLITFCLMELFRRGRFKLTPYVFDACSAYDRYLAIIRDNYIGAASWKVRRAFSRRSRSTF